MWKNQKGAYYIKVYYWVPPVNPDTPPTDKDFVDLTAKISGCKAECDLDSFIKRSEQYKVDDPETVIFDTFNYLIIFSCVPIPT